MTKTLKSMLRPDYLQIIKARMMEMHWNNSALSRRTGFSKPHIGNVLKGAGSDDALAAICQVLNIEIRRDLFKPVADEGGEDRGGSNNQAATG